VRVRPATDRRLEDRSVSALPATSPIWRSVKPPPGRWRRPGAEMQRTAQSLDQRNELPDDLAGPAFFLASADSDFMTCQTLLVDGGRSMW
jgi:NAD(P)-dependent dehydrogenase (short-subunit alcohol dehydrogenase family)